MDSSINAAILESMNDGVLVIDFNGRIVFVNRAGSELLQLEVSEVVKENYTDIFMSEAENDAFNDILFNGIQNRETRVYCEVPFRRSDGKRFELAVTSSFLRNKEGPEQGEGIVVVFKDVTESKALDRARQRVLDHLSHELRTPLTIIHATVKRAIGPENANLGERIEQNLKRLQEIQIAVDDIVNRKDVKEKHPVAIWMQQVDYILDIMAEEKEEYRAAIIAVKDEMTRLFGKDYSCSQSVDTAEELMKAMEQVRESAGHRVVSLLTKIEESPRVWIDPQALIKIFITLIKNGIEATPDGGDITISLSQKNGYVIYEVKDTGIGITPESQANIFGGFYHARETDLYSTKKPYDFGAGGKGLELLRLKIFAELFQFTVECESKRCAYIPDESHLCPGSIEACIHVHDKGECAGTGGTTFRLKFRIFDD